MSDEPVNLRYMVEDPLASADWYVEMFGFSKLPNSSPAFAAVEKGPLRLLLSGKMSSAGRAMPDGRQPVPGGWNRFQVIVTDNLFGDIITDLYSVGCTAREQLERSPSTEPEPISGCGGSYDQVTQMATEIDRHVAARHRSELVRGIAGTVGNVTIDRSIFSPTDIPPFAYGLDPPAPALPCRTLSTRLVMIAYAPTDPEAIARLLETIHDGPMTGLLAPQPLREQTPLFPFHRGTELYMKRDEPTLTPEMIEKLTKAAGGVGALVSGIVAFYGFLRIRQLRRFESYFWDLHRLELLARGREIDTEAPTNPKELQAYLEGLLLDLKSQAIRDFAEGGLKGEGLMAGIVSLANDIRKTIRTIGEESQRPQGTPT